MALVGLLVTVSGAAVADEVADAKKAADDAQKAADEAKAKADAADAKAKKAADDYQKLVGECDEKRRKAAESGDYGRWKKVRDECRKLLGEAWDRYIGARADDDAAWDEYRKKLHEAVEARERLEALLGGFEALAMNDDMRVEDPLADAYLVLAIDYELVCEDGVATELYAEVAEGFEVSEAELEAYASRLFEVGCDDAAVEIAFADEEFDEALPIIYEEPVLSWYTPREFLSLDALLADLGADDASASAPCPDHAVPASSEDATAASSSPVEHQREEPQGLFEFLFGWWS